MTKDGKIMKFEDLIKAKESDSEEEPVSVNKELKGAIIRGIPKSGKIWKTERKKFSSVIKTKGIRDSWAKKQSLKHELNRIKNISKELKEERNKEKELRKERRRENIKRRAENEKKAEIVQVISNSNKIKRMKKKQLRYIEKRDTTVVSKS